jgi:hypothetical protein
MGPGGGRQLRSDDMNSGGGRELWSGEMNPGGGREFRSKCVNSGAGRDSHRVRSGARSWILRGACIRERGHEFYCILERGRVFRSEGMDGPAGARGFWGAGGVSSGAWA